MRKEPWTLLLLRGETRRIRQYSLSSKAVRPTLVGACLACVLWVGAGAFALFDTGARVRAAALARENQLLKAEIPRIAARLAEFDQRFDGLAEQSRRARLLAGMSGIDEEVFDVGIGGPGLEFPDEASESVHAVRYDLDVLERKASLLAQSFDESAERMAAQGDLLKSTPSLLPASGLVSSSFSGKRFHPLLEIDRPHHGVDIHAPHGTPIVAAADGRVAFVGWKVGYGNTVEIQHEFGFVTLYAHASVLLVRRGQQVARGEVVAEVGETGLATAPHLHYEVRLNGRPVDPENYFVQ